MQGSVTGRISNTKQIPPLCALNNTFSHLQQTWEVIRSCSQPIDILHRCCITIGFTGQISSSCRSTGRQLYVSERQQHGGKSRTVMNGHTTQEGISHGTSVYPLIHLYQVTLNGSKTPFYYFIMQNRGFKGNQQIFPPYNLSRESEFTFHIKQAGLRSRKKMYRLQLWLKKN